MSRQRKRQFRFATFIIVPALLLIAALVPAIMSSNANAISTSQWDTVRGYINSYYGGSQYNASQDGEAGFRMGKVELWNRLDSNGNISPNYGAAVAPIAGEAVTGVLGEGDDMANRPVLIDNLMNRTDVIPGTEFRCAWNANESCFADSSITAIRQIVDNHRAAGFSTDIVDYCVSSQTAGPSTGGFGIIAQVPGALSSDTSLIPRVYIADYSRNGWRNSLANAPGVEATAAPEASAGGFAAPETVDNCNGAASDYELVRCQANWAISVAPNGNVGNGQTTITTIAAAGQSVDVRAGSITTMSSAGTNLQVPINTLFSTSGLANLDPLATTVLTGRTQMGSTSVIGLKMLGYSMIANGSITGGIHHWNGTLGEQQAAYGPGLPVQSIAAYTAPAKVDTTGPTITVAPSVSNITVNSATVSRTAGEPATMKVEYGTASGVYSSTENNTVLNAVKSVDLTGLAPSTTYYYKVTSYDGHANGTVSTESSFTTATPADADPPTITNVQPADGSTIYTTSATISAYLDDGAGSGINTDPGTTMVHVDSSMIMSGCTITDSSISCPKSGLAYGPHNLEILTADLAGNPATSETTFNVGDNAAPAVTFTYPAQDDWISDNTPTITGTYSDPAPSSGILGASLSLDGTTSFPYSCSAVGGNVSCNVTPALADGLYHGSIGVEDNAGHVTNSAVVDFVVDATLPVVSNVQPSGISNLSDVVVTGTIDDGAGSVNDATMSVMLDGTPLNCTYHVDRTFDCLSTPVTEGDHTITVSAEDIPGNIGTGGSTFTTDTVDPVISNNQPTGTTGNDSPTISASYSDGTGTGIDTGSVDVQLNGSPMAGCTVGATSVSCPSSGLTDGPYTVILNVDDNAGNTGTLEWDFTINSAAPVIDSFDPTAGEWTADNTPTITMNYHAGSTIIDASLEIDGVACAGASWDQYSISCTAPPLADGTRTVHGSVSVEGAPASTYNWSFHVDATPPATTDNAPAEWQNTDFDVTLACDDGTGNGCAATQYRVDFATTADSWHTGNTVAITTEGDHVIDYYSTDLLTNAETPFNSVHAMLDKTDPTVSNIAPFSTIATGSPHFTGSWSDGLSGIITGPFDLKIDGSNWPSGGCVVNVTGFDCTLSVAVPDGAHTIDVTIMDAAYNVGTGSGSFTVDTTGPSITNISPAGTINDATPLIEADLADATGVNTASVAVYLDDSETPLDNCDVTASSVSCQILTDLTEGAHDISVTAADTLGNTSSSEDIVFTVQLERTYYFPWYDNSSGGMNGDWIMITNDGATDAAVDVYVADTKVMSFDGGVGAGHADKIGPEQQVEWQSPTPITDGPVRVISDGNELLVSQRVIYKDSFNEITAREESELSADNYFTWYDNRSWAGMNGNWICVSNAGATEAAVAVYIAGDLKTTLTIPAGGHQEWQSPDILKDGPVRVVDANLNPLVVSQRVLYKNAFNEVMGAAFEKLDTEAYFTWYDNNPAWGMNQNWVLAANVDTQPTDIEIYIDDLETPVATFTDVAPGDMIHWLSPETITDGPLRVISPVADAQTILVSQRVIYKDSFEEIQGTSPNDMSSSAGFSWYCTKLGHDVIGDWIMIGNENATAATVGVSVGGTPMSYGGSTDIAVPAHSSVTPWFSDLMDGPIEVTCTDCGVDENLIISQRVIYKNSFNEVVAAPYH